MSDTVTPFLKGGRYTDIRVAVGDVFRKHPDTAEGIIILFPNDSEMSVIHVCKSRDLAFAGAVLLKDAVEEA